jgi:hypothetical protein
MRPTKSYSAAESVFAVFLILLAFAMPAHAQNYKFKVLHTFLGPDGALPVGQLVRDEAGNLYGVADAGGTGKCQVGCGTAFQMNKSGKIIWVHKL